MSIIENKRHIHVSFPKVKDYPEYNDINTEFETLFDTEQLTDIVEDIDTYNERRRRKEVFTAPDLDLLRRYDINDLFSASHIAMIRDAYIFKSHSDAFNPSEKNIAVHIRRGDVPNISRGRYTRLDFFVNTVQKLVKGMRDEYSVIRIHIYSDSILGVEDERKFNAISPTSYHYDSDLLKSFHDMVSSDIFIGSIGSNMTHLVALLRNGDTIVDSTKVEEGVFNYRYNNHWSKLNSMTLL